MDDCEIMSYSYILKTGNKKVKYDSEEDEEIQSYSVTDIVNFYFPNFEYCKAHDSVVTRAQNKGKLVHKIIELYFTYQDKFKIDYFLDNCDSLNDTDKIFYKHVFNKFFNFHTSQSNWKILIFEKNMKRGFLCGRPDAIYECKDNSRQFNYYNLLKKYEPYIMSGIKNKKILEEKYMIKKSSKKHVVLVDWKYSSSINIFDKYIKRKNCYKCINIKDKVSQLVYSDLSETKYNKFLIQLNVYKYIIEHEYGYHVLEMFTFVMNPENNQYSLIPVLFFTNKYTSFLIDNFKNKRSLFKDTGRFFKHNHVLFE